MISIYLLFIVNTPACICYYIAYMAISKLLDMLPSGTSFSSSLRPYFNHSVSFKKEYTSRERFEKLSEIGLNVFFFPSEMVSGCDLLSDSGTTTMTDRQWASLHLGDEAYGSNKGYFLLLDQIAQTFGQDYVTNPAKEKPSVFIFHQGRPGEHALFGFLGSTGNHQIIPSNGHFDTTQANIEANRIDAINLFSPELKDPGSSHHFKGDMDIARLRQLLKTNAKQIPVVYLTITNNTGGGQPVSLANIKAVADLAHTYKIPLMLDACRFAENAWFIKQYEKGYKDKSIQQIVLELFSYADGFSISFKKDGLVNMGGGVILKQNGLMLKKYPHIQEALMNHQIITEGHPSYGGISGRDIMALVYGLQTIIQNQYLSYRIGQVHSFGSEMETRGLPVLTPFGGHAVYLDMNRFFKGTRLTAGDFGGISFTSILLCQYGHRACELGNFAFGSYDPKTKKETFPEVNYVRFAIPRLRYEEQDLTHVASSVEALYKTRDQIPGVTVTYGKELALRHFKARFEFKS